MSIDAESLRQQIPYYLTAKDQAALVEQLGAFSAGKSPDYLLGERQDGFRNEMLQGDGWSGLQLFIHTSGERRAVRGIILSNSCDVAIENKRDVPTRLVFAPLVKLSTFVRLLTDAGVSGERLDAKIASIKAQKTTNIMYLPAGQALADEYIVRLDDVHSMPTTGQKSAPGPKKIFTLSMVGFYLFVFKLSIHFCRLQENVQRGPATA